MACAVRNLCYASVLSDLQAVRRSKSLASVRHNEERERVSEGTAADCPFKCLNRVHKISNYIQYMLVVTIKHYDKLKIFLLTY